VEVHQSPNFDHHQDWMVSIRTGRKPVMNIQAGVATANLTILGNLSLILGRKLQWDPVKQTIVGDDQAQRMMSRPTTVPVRALMSAPSTLDRSNQSPTRHSP
jgi:hypothetical protein